MFLFNYLFINLADCHYEAVCMLRAFCVVAGSALGFRNQSTGQAKEMQ